MTSSLLTGNYASHGGGAVYLASAVASFTHCTIADSTAGTAGGGILLDDTSSADIVNSILWNAGDEVAGIIASVHHSDVEGGYARAGNIDADPLFVGGGDYHLTDGSPCIEAGCNGAAGLPASDIDGEARVMDGDGNGHAIVDMGFDEVPAPPAPEWTAAATNPSGPQRGLSGTVNGLGMALLPLAAVLVWRRRFRRA